MTAILILNYNNYEDTINCIKSIEKYNTAKIKYFIVDNGSSRNGVVEELDSFFNDSFRDCYSKFEYENSQKSSFARVNFIVSKTNDGYAAGNNKGLEYIYEDNEINNVLIINNDVLFVEDILPTLIQYLNKLPNSGIVSPLLYKKDLVGIDYNCARLNQSNWDIIRTYIFLYRDIGGILTKARLKQQILKRNPEYLNKDYFEIELPSGSCMLINKKTMNNISGFDPNTFLYYEENILFNKLSKIGKSNYIIPSLKCIHLGASSTSKSLSSFILKTGLNSMRYYLQNYCELTFLQNIALQIAYLLFMLKIKLASLLKSSKK